MKIIIGNNDAFQFYRSLPRALSLMLLSSMLLLNNTGPKNSHHSSEVVSEGDRNFGMGLFASAQRYDIDETRASVVKRRKSQVYSAADKCVSSSPEKTSLGEEFLDCVLQSLSKEEERGEHRGGDEDEDEDENRVGVGVDPFPVPPYTRHPLTVQRLVNDPADHATMLMDLLRNYTCSRTQDKGSDVIATSSWTYDELKAMKQSDEMSCPAPAQMADDSDDSSSSGPEWNEGTGFLPAGDDLVEAIRMNVDEAKVYCDSLPACSGFTYNVNSDDDDSERPTIFFKGGATMQKVVHDENWKSHVRKRIPERCRASRKNPSALPSDLISDPIVREYKLEILRHSPLVVIVPEFATDAECNKLIAMGGSEEVMGRAFEAGGPSSYRRSYSSNIDVNYDDRTSWLTRFAERMFAFVRDVAGYDVHGPGQEPINAVLYKNVGDEYRPHCDGPCRGGPYRFGKRVATTILYCVVPDDGSGQTSFTRSGMMIAPRKGDLLLFAYKHNENNTVDDGFTEHSGCPIQGGKKWIATQWYREGVDYEHPWAAMENWDRS